MRISLKEFKEKYSVLQKEYSLPEFEKLNREFEIEKIDKETDIFLKSIRKVVMEKVLNALNFLEMLLNPMNAPRMYLRYLNSISNEDSELINKMYSILSNLVLGSLQIEMEYDEKKEADMIKRIYKDWTEIQIGMAKILENMKSPKDLKKKERDYFG